MKKSELKPLIKVVLREIYQKPTQLSGFMGLISKLADYTKNKIPEINDINKGYILSHKILIEIKQNINVMIQEILKKNKDEYVRNFRSFSFHLDQLTMLLITWAQKIDDNSDKHEKISREMNEVKRHSIQIIEQFERVYISLQIKNKFGGYNIINAKRELSHLNEIFKSMKITIDELFKIGFDAGLSNENQPKFKKKI